MKSFPLQAQTLLTHRGPPHRKDLTDASRSHGPDPKTGTSKELLLGIARRLALPKAKDPRRICTQTLHFSAFSLCHHEQSSASRLLLQLPARCRAVLQPAPALGLRHSTHSSPKGATGTVRMLQHFNQPNSFHGSDGHHLNTNAAPVPLCYSQYRLMI